MPHLPKGLGFSLQDNSASAGHETWLAKGKLTNHQCGPMTRAVHPEQRIPISEKSAAFFWHVTPVIPLPDVSSLRKSIRAGVSGRYRVQRETSITVRIPIGGNEDTWGLISLRG